MKLIGVLFMFALPVLAQEKPFDYHSSEELQQKTREAMTKAAASPAGLQERRLPVTATMPSRLRPAPSPVVLKCMSSGRTSSW